MKNILVVVESIDVDDSSGSKANVALIRNLAKAGFTLRVYHYTRKEVLLERIETSSLKENRKSLLFFLSRLERYIRYKLGLSLNHHIERFFGFSFTLFNDRNSIASELKKVKDFNPDLVLTLSKGGSFRPHHALLKIPEWHDRWMAYIHDPYPMHSYPRPYDWVEPGHQRKRSFFLKVAKQCKYAAYPGKMLGEWMESYYPDLKGKRIIIPHQIDEGFQLQKEEFPDFFYKDKFSIVHAGALMGARNPTGLLSAFRRFLKAYPEVKDQIQLIFIGAKSRYSKLFEDYRKEVPQFHSTEENLPFGVVRGVQQSASVNIILEAKGPVSPFLPGKFPHCIQSGKPILLLGPYYSESRRLLGRNYKYWSEIDDEERIFEHLGCLFSQWRKGALENTFAGGELKDYLSVPYLRETISRL